jgi:uncharacterized beta-barrel protein YwiB (DUF1934 family)
MIIKIKSSDIHGQDYEREFPAIRNEVGENSRIEYIYTDEYGDCKIYAYTDFIEIYRKGEVNSKQVFKLEEKTIFKYVTKEFRGEYHLFSKKININGKKIYVEYDIIQENEIINSLKLEIVEV